MWPGFLADLLDDEFAPMRGWLAHNVGAYVAYAVGRVSLWGRVLEFEDGYRAEHAYPYALRVFSLEQGMAAARRRLTVARGHHGGASPCPTARNVKATL